MNIDQAFETPIASIVEYDDFRAKIAVMREACNFLPDTTTEEGYTKSKRLSLDVGKLLTALEAKRKLIKSEPWELCGLIDAEAKKLREEFEGYQLPHKDAYQKVDDDAKRQKRLPFAPPDSRKAPILAACPMHMVLTSGRMNCMVSYIDNPALTDPPGELIYR